MNTPINTEGTVRKIEAAIDKWVLALPILKNPTPSCMWHFLVAHESHLRTRVFSVPPNSASFLALSDNAKYALKYSFEWALQVARGGVFSVPYAANQKRLRQAEEAFSHASMYKNVVSAFTNYSRGLATAEVIDEKTVRFHRSPEALRYDVMGMIIAQTRSGHPGEDRVYPQMMDVHRNLSILLKSIDLLGHRGVRYQVSPYDLTRTIEILRPALQNTRLLPSGWKFRGISIQSFREVWLWLNARCIIHSIIHDSAEIRGNATASLTSVILTSQNSLVEDIARATSNLERGEIEAVIELLVYNQNFPAGKRDPALQPLIPISTGDSVGLGIAPRLINSSNGERNLVSLLARHYKSEYDNTTGGLEEEQLSQIKELLQGTNHLVATQKKVPGRKDLPDIDIAIADPKSGCLLLVEVKWTIEPSEAWEMIERAEVQRKGISQAQKLVEYSRKHPHVIWSLCFPGIALPGTLRIEACVAIRGFAGTVPKSPTEPVVVPEFYLCKYLKKNTPLNEIIDWLLSRGFVPTEGIDFKKGEFSCRFGEYSVYWPNFAILRDETP